MSFDISSYLMDMAISNERNQKIQEVCVTHLYQWWKIHHPLNETPCQMEEERKILLVKSAQLMNSHSPNVKEYVFGGTCN